MKISIITPVYGHANMTGQFINSIVGYMDNDTELIIVDNNSPDNTMNVVTTALKSYPNKNINLFHWNKNLGFGAANNAGSRIAQSDKLLFISNDVVILGDFITPVYEFLEQDASTACGPHLFSHDTGWNTFKETSIIPYIEGFCFGIHKRNFDMIQGFDEKFFLDMEDLDFSYRLHLAGVGLAQINLPVIHQLGGSFDQLNIKRSDITEQSLQYFMEKWALTR